MKLISKGFFLLPLIKVKYSCPVRLFLRFDCNPRWHKNNRTDFYATYWILQYLIYIFFILSVSTSISWTVLCVCVQRCWRKAARSTRPSCRGKWRLWETNRGVLSTATSCCSTSAHCPETPAHGPDSWVTPTAFLQEKSSLQQPFKCLRRSGSKYFFDRDTLKSSWTIRITS